MKLRLRYGQDTKLEMFCSDVKEMFCNLSHNGILLALTWLFDILGKQKQYQERGGILRTPRKTRKNRVTLITNTNEIYWGAGNHEGHQRQIKGNNEDVVTFTFSDLRSIISMDLNFTYSTVGKTLLKQKLGCPIGGILSCFYANLYCAMKENEYITRDTLDRHNRIYGIRQVDDLIMWIAYDKNDPNTHRQASNSDIRGDV